MQLDEEVLESLKALASENRQRILLLFVDGLDRTVNQVAQEVGLAQSTTSEQLGILKRAGLLVAERHGKETYYRPNRAHMNRFLEKLSAMINACCPR